MGGFLEDFGAGSVSGVEVLSFSTLSPGDRLEVLEGGLDSFGEVEALPLSFFGTMPFSFGLLSILTAGGASCARSSSSILPIVALSPARGMKDRKMRKHLYARQKSGGYEGNERSRKDFAQAIDVSNLGKNLCKRALQTAKWSIPRI